MLNLNNNFSYDLTTKLDFDNYLLNLRKPTKNKMFEK